MCIKKRSESDSCLLKQMDKNGGERAQEALLVYYVVKQNPPGLKIW